MDPAVGGQHPYVAEPSSRVGQSTAFKITAYAFTATMLGTTLPTPLYPGYEQRFGFGSLTVTIVFATYAFGVLTALLGFGRASDAIGRRPSLFAGLAAAFVSSVVFIVVGYVHTGGLVLLLIGRFISGLSAGVFTGTATAALADYAGDAKLRASMTAAVANIGGLGLGPLVAGALGRQATKPLLIPYYLHLDLIAIAAVLIAVIPEPVAATGQGWFSFQRLSVPSGLRATFIQAGTAGFAGFAVLGFFTAVSPATLGLLGHHDPLVTGLVVFAVFAASAGGQALSIRPSVRTALLGGTAILIVGIAGVGVSIGIKSLPLLIAGGIVAGIGQGLSFRSALGSITGAAPPDQRATVSSSFFAICYVGISLPVIGVGAATDAYGLVRAGEVFAGIVAALALATLAALARSEPIEAGATG